MADNLREYLISLGFDVNKAQQADMVSAVRAGAFEANLLFAALSGAVTKFHETMSSVAGGLNDLYINSRILKDSAADIYAWEVALQKAGFSAQQANSLLKSIGFSLRRDPGAAGVAAHFAHISVAALKMLPPTQQAIDLIKGLGELEKTNPKYAETLESRFLPLWGMSFEDFKKLLLPGILDYPKPGAGLTGEFKTWTDDAHEFSKAMVDLNSEFYKLGVALADPALEWYTGIIKELTEYFTAHDKDIKEFFDNISGGAGSIEHALKALGTPDIRTGLDGTIQDFENLAKVFKTIADLMDHMTTSEFWKRWFSHEGENLQYYLNPFASNEARSRQMWERDHPDVPYPGGGINLHRPHHERNIFQKGWDWLRGKVTGEAATPSGSDAGSLTDLITREAQRAGIDPRIMEGIRAGESLHTARYDIKNDALESSWGPFQLNRRRGLGVQFEHDTGLDVRDPATIPAQVRWVAEYIKKHGGTNGQWMGYRGPRDAQAWWGNSGYRPTPVATAKSGSGYSPWSSILGISPAQAADIKNGIAMPSYGAGTFGSDVGIRDYLLHHMPYGPLTLGGTGPQSSNNSLNQKTTINLYGVGEGNEELGSKIARRQNNVNSALLRNLANNSAVG